MKNKQHLFSIVVSLLLLNMFSIKESFSESSDSCVSSAATPMPKWVDLGYAYNKKGYRYGFGIARFDSNKTKQKLLDEAALYARQDIASGIETKVISDINISIDQISTLNIDSVNKNIKTRTKSSSNISLPGLSIYKSWQDNKSCDVYVQIRVKDAIVRIYTEKLKAENFFKEALNTKKSISDRTFLIKEAIKIAESYKFSQLQKSLSSAQSLRKYRRELDKLNQIKNKQKNAFVIINNTKDKNDAALDILRKEFMSSIDGLYEIQSNCDSITDCMKSINETEAKYAVIIVLNMHLKKISGIWSGELNADLSYWDVIKNQNIISTADIKANVINRHKSKITLDKSLIKLIKINQNNLKGFMDKVKS